MIIKYKGEKYTVHTNDLDLDYAIEYRGYWFYFYEINQSKFHSSVHEEMNYIFHNNLHKLKYILLRYNKLTLFK